MKTSKHCLLSVSQNRAVQKQSISQLSHKVLKDTDLVLYQPKSLVRIEATTHWSSAAEKIGARRVFYRKRHLTNEGDLDWRRLALEILPHLPAYSET